MKIFMPVALVVAAASLAMMAQNSFAASANTSFNVKVQIAASCTVSATAMDFGTISTVVGTETATSTVNVTCNKGTAYGLSFTNVATIAAATTTAAINLNNGANVIPATVKVTSGGAGIGTGLALPGLLTGTLTATPNPATGTYSNTQTLYVIY